MDFGDDERFRVRPGVVHREIDGEVVLIDAAGSAYFGLNAPGSELWARLVEGATVGDLLDVLLEQFEIDAATARQDVVELLGDLVDRGLIERG